MYQDDVLTEVPGQGQNNSSQKNVPSQTPPLSRQVAASEACGVDPVRDTLGIGLAELGCGRDLNLSFSKSESPEPVAG